jgi:hypothetical protein
MRKTIVTLAVAAAALLLATGVAFAGKPSSSLSLVVLPVGTPAGSQTTATAEASYGGQVTFDVSTTETDQPLVNVRCYQGGIFVYDAWQGFWPGYYTDPVFTLSSGYWTGGAADCTARLVSFGSNGREKTLASVGFHVAA